LQVNDSSYRFFYREKDSGFSDTVVVAKNDSVNYVYYDFNHRQQVSLEPSKDEWDLQFGPYYDLATLFGVTIPYQVGGTFINTWREEAVLDSIHQFDAISLSMVPGYHFTKQRDNPGYRWKGVTVDITGGGSASYAVKSNYTYVFRTSGNQYFKLRFLSYSLDGRSGYPRFEYRTLE